ncbi:sulfotransferase domain-containing protein [Waterburya agarophytonicola K14]|uniref:Sulfotransferase domain-containing protein n=1 Tax=Waterburya agarophytonicola KI4 TaxID=2874699 RepID=A0A964BNC7_9CYAN|nr:sulfotransferase domain-containing protein [Waterburya agarophytonicola]MCC0176430.1 sulfotransferase domain-containing protein [Waterburya agarophytonicola KI4]
METFKDIGKPIVIASHPRSGTHLTIDLLRKQFKECQSSKKLGEPLNRLYCGLDPQNLLSDLQAFNILQQVKRPLVKTHCYPQFSYLSSEKISWVNWLKKEADIYYVLRDGRDVMCSLHLFMQSYDPSTRCSLSEFIRQKTGDTSRIKNWANHIKMWLDEPKVKILKFENVIKNTESVLENIQHDLELTPLHQQPILPTRIKSLWHGRWIILTQRKAESTAIIGYYRGQKVSKWQTAFTLEDRKFINSEVGDLLIQLGYEKSNNWM